MENKGYGDVSVSSGQFQQYSHESYEASKSQSTSGSTNYGGSYYQPSSGYLQQGQHYQTAGFQQQPVLGIQVVNTDPRKVYQKRTEGLTKLRNVGIFNMTLALATATIGLATLIVASENIGFPVFNFGVLLVGILHFFPAVFDYLAAKKGLNSINESSLQLPNSIKYYILGQFIFSVLVITLAFMAATFAFLSGAVCAGADITFRSRNNNEVKNIDVQQYCEPNDDSNAALAFVGGCLCIIVGIMSIYGAAWVCCYGLYFGWRRHTGGRITFGVM